VPERGGWDGLRLERRVDEAHHPPLPRRLPQPAAARQADANVTDIQAIAKAAADGGADAVSAVNTFVGWRWTGGGASRSSEHTGGLSGPAIKPLALRAVWQIAKLKACRWSRSAALPRSTT